MVAPAGNAFAAVVSRSSTTNVAVLASYKSRVAGVVFNDINANGTRDGGEGTIGGVQVFISSDPNATAPAMARGARSTRP